MSLRALVAVPFVRFLGVGVFNTALGYALFAAFVLIGAPTLMAVMASIRCVWRGQAALALISPRLRRGQLRALK